MPQCSFVEHRSYKVIYRRYASLFFLVGVDGGEVRAVLHRTILQRVCPLHKGLVTCRLWSAKQRRGSVTDHCLLPVQNELAILEFIHCMVETMDRYFGNVVSVPCLLMALPTSGYLAWGSVLL